MAGTSQENEPYIQIINNIIDLNIYGNLIENHIVSEPKLYKL